MANERDKIFKSWSGISELALIKEVATKGEHINLCISYWAQKRKMSVNEYEVFFHDIVQTYVKRLLNERLVCKAETVLRNVQRDVKYFYYQFACECTDPELRELLMEHLRKKDPHGFEKDIQELRFYWELLQKIKCSEKIMSRLKQHLRRVNMESIMGMDTATLHHIMIELYFETGDESLLCEINKFIMWNFLVESNQDQQIILWCKQVHRNNATNIFASEVSALERKYSQWPIESEMYEHALSALKNNRDEVLRNFFAAEGFFFPDERDNIEIVLRRVCITNSVDVNRSTIKTFHFGRFIFEREFFYLLLKDFVPARQLEELAEEESNTGLLIKLLLTLKTFSLENLEGFKKINFATTIYIEALNGREEANNCLLATFFEFLANQPSLVNLQCAITSGMLKSLKYLKITPHQYNESNSTLMQHNLPRISDLLNKFLAIDINRLNKDSKGFKKAMLADDGNRKNHYLNFVHYIKQNRSTYAVYLMLIEQLQSYSQITKTHLFTTCESVYEVALQTQISDYDVISHCIAFCEVLGFDTQQLRCILKLKKYLQKNDSVLPSGHRDIAYVVTEGERLLMKQLSKADADDTGRFPLNLYNAIMTCKSSILNRSPSRSINSLAMQHYAANNDYWHLLVLWHYFEIPLEQIKYMVKYFNIFTIGDHLLRALSFSGASTEGNVLKRRSSLTKRQIQSSKTKKDEKRGTNTSIETMTSSVASGNEMPVGAECSSVTNQNNFVVNCTNGGPDIFALILLNMNSNADNEQIENMNKFLEIMQKYKCSEHREASTVIKFLSTAVEQSLPIMALLAASVSSIEEKNTILDWCWLVWLVVTTEQWNSLARLAVDNGSQEFPWNLFDYLVVQSQISSIVRSFQLFYPNNALIHLFRFLHMSMRNEFGDDTVHEMRLYCLAWSNEEIRLPLCSWPQREKLMKRTIRTLLLHIQNNFESAFDQLQFLACVCKSGLSDITGQMDFCLLKHFCDILMTINGAAQRFPINFVQLLTNEEDDVKEYERILGCVLAAKEYDVALRLAALLHKPISDIIYSKWVTSLEMQLAVPSAATFDDYHFPFEQYEHEVSSHSLPPETLVNFLLYASSHLPTGAFKSRYYVLQKALNVIKHHHLFPNESFDRDQIEYDMIVNYLCLEDDSEVLASLPLYHSEYFEEIMLYERRVLYKTFLELKELAGIDDLNISNKHELKDSHRKRLESLLHRLLEEGDIVEALRLQELFDIRPLDLRFIVFCMALAESMSSIYCMSADERQLLGETERSSFSKFTRRTLCSVPGGVAGYLSDSCSTLEFEEIPSKEKQETLAVLQGIASKLKYGVNLAKRIISCYRAAMYLDKDYTDVLRTKDVHVLLQSIAEEGCLHRLLVVSDILTSTHMESKEIAELLSYEITTAVVRPRFYIFSPDQNAKAPFRNADLWGHNIDRDLHLFLELTPDRTKLGACLLEYCDALKIYRRYQDNKPYDANIYFQHLANIIARYGLPSNNGEINDLNSVNSNQGRPSQVLSHKKQNIIYVELLIKAHQAFVHECSMEGIANVLSRAKALNNVLAQAKSWSLIVRMLTGIGRYREMYFCFYTLIANEQFESLLGQFDEEKTIGLKQAILAYLREYCAPKQGKELFKLAALHFLMYKDLAELWEQDAEEILNHIHNTMSISDDGGAATGLRYLRCTPDVINQLSESLQYYVHATENYLLDNKLRLAQKSAAKAELTAMQIDLANKSLENPPTSNSNHLCLCVIQLKSGQHFRTLVNDKLSVPQALIFSRAYGYDINWSEALLSQYIIQTKQTYLEEFLQELEITDDCIENVVKGFQIYAKQQRITKQMDEHIAQMVELVSSVSLKYKLASVLTLKSTILSLINNDSIHFLRDKTPKTTPKFVN
ncbi:uncharacterized protein LOC106084269 [Stomoxys calcitrans]|uniref:Spatacsin C-terminal domain-containing protein n=1 Tax=Stomoxys calcitrans TaxID=35570 RepID=A0A1I8NPH5_STOCA|nr:uncharacterized protein LOC106084269 [Stomoxys calcitrans]